MIKYALILVIHLFEPDKSVFLQVGTKEEGPMVFNSFVKCENYFFENIIPLRLWSLNMIPKDKLVKDISFLCYKEEDVIPDYKKQI